METDKLQVADLKRELDRRGEDTRGTKSVLRERLEQVLREEAIAHGTLDDKNRDVEAVPVQGKEESKGDAKSVRSSHSGISTRVSSRASVASERALEAARRAGLHAKAAALKKRHEIEELQEQLRRKKEELEIQAELDESLAKEDVLAQFEEDGALKREIAMQHEDRRQQDGNEEQENREQEDRKEKQENREEKQEYRKEKQDYRKEKQEDRKEKQEDRKEKQEDRREKENRKQEQEDTRQEEKERTQEMEGLPVRLRRAEVEIASVIPSLKRVGMQPLELHAFDGKQEEFLPFLTAFEANIATRLDSEEEKLLYLLQMTKKKPHDLVATCIYLGEKGYQEAVRLLKARFSNSTEARACLIDKMRRQPAIKYDDVEGFDNFTILLRGVLNALQSPSLGDAGLESTTICQIVEKVPWMMDRWRRLADKIEQEEHRQANFKELVKFMELEARISKNPAYGMHVLSTRSRTERRPQETQRTQEVRSRTLVGSVKKIEKCLFCDQPHEVDVCEKFASKTEEEKTKYVMAYVLAASRRDTGLKTVKKGKSARDARGSILQASTGKKSPEFFLMTKVCLWSRMDMYHRKM